MYVWGGSWTGLEGLNVLWSTDDVATNGREGKLWTTSVMYDRYMNHASIYCVGSFLSQRHACVVLIHDD